MDFRISTLWIATLGAILATVSCTGLSSKAHDPLVFALNLSDQTVALSLVRDGVTLVSFGAVGSMESISLTKVSSASGVLLRQESGTTATAWTDPSGTPYSLQLKTGSLYAIVVDHAGQAALYTLPESYSSDPKICTVNSTSLPLSQVQVAPDWGKNVKIYSQDVPPVVPSEFYSIEPKTLGLYWQTLAQEPSGSHTTATDAKGKPLRLPFEPRHYYLFLAGEGSLRDISPVLE